MYIFLSHASKEHGEAEKLCNLLESKGHQCFLAPRNIRSGHEYAEEILDGIERSDVMVLFLSEAANESPHVLREIERAVSKKIKIVVYQLEKVQLSKSMEYFLMSHQWVNTAANTGHESILACVEELTVGEQIPGHTEELNKQKTEKSAFTAFLKKYRRLIMALILIIFAAVLLEDAVGRYKQNKEGAVSGPEENSLPTETKTVELGDTVVFGSYHNEPIEWRVLRLNEDGTAVLVSGYILTMKAFDAAEGGRYNYMEGNYWTDDISTLEAEQQCQLRGNNRWSVSNIRTWLNSEKENVVYEDQAPKATAMSELVNGYDTEAGFLHGFTKEERAAIRTTTVTTGDEVTEDRVFLLSSEELVWFEDADVSPMTVPKASALEQDKTGWYQLFALDYNVEDYYWWLRDADRSEGARQCEAYVVTNSYSSGQLITRSVGLEGFGIRPAMTVDVTADCIVIKNGE